LQDAEEATDRWRIARADGPELGEMRELDPGQRHAWVQRMMAEEAHGAALRRYERERDRLYKMLDAHERAAEPIPPWAISDSYGD
jgi:hypothetical protein